MQWESRWDCLSNKMGAHFKYKKGEKQYELFRRNVTSGLCSGDKEQ